LKFINGDPGKFYKCLGPHYVDDVIAARLSIVHWFTMKAMLSDEIVVLVRTLSEMGQYWRFARMRLAK
ncbi:hypothetical protein V1506DRAFT_546655, partial [Lipomyces tetrasporus]